ncbi:hypothetical protein ANCDUO_17217, partial [Ancylostoma duodenale]
LGVAYILTNEAKVFDAATLAAALLHDTVEDTKTTLEEIKEQFGQEVHDIVKECTDDKSLPKEVRKKSQIENAPHHSHKLFPRLPHPDVWHLMHRELSLRTSVGLGTSSRTTKLVSAGLLRIVLTYWEDQLGPCREQFSYNIFGVYGDQFSHNELNVYEPALAKST